MPAPTESRRFDFWRCTALVCLLWALGLTSWIWLERHHAQLDQQIMAVADQIEHSRQSGDGPASNELYLRPEGFADLPGWQGDRHSEALVAMVRSCKRFAVFSDSQELSPTSVGGRVGDWRAACAAILDHDSDTTPPEQARLLLEQHFRPFRALDALAEGSAQTSEAADIDAIVVPRRRGVGLFTGYYEASLDGSLQKKGPYQTPLYRLPNDIVKLDLGRFAPDLKGRTVGARYVGRRLEPYPDRGQIVNGALRGRGLELLYVDDPVDAFFLQIQGSGQVRLDDGRTWRVGYAGQNGHAYFAVGRALIDRGEVPREKMSMQAIRQWLDDNPEQSEELMSLNRSFVFFRKLDTEGPIGSQGVVLTPRRSLAVDRSFIPMGTPIWLDGWAPSPEDDDPEARDPSQQSRLRRLLIAQDTGGAIRGPVRGDVFWGAGDTAADIAGRMKHQGRYWLLLPLPLASEMEQRWQERTPVATRG
jgi:membrane-bound lytic murein transglycosylase A